MENFLNDFGLALIIGSIFGLILVVCGMLAEKCGLADKLANMFADNEDKEKE